MYIYSNYDHYKTNISIENISEKYINVHSNILFFWSYLLFCPFYFVYWMISKYNSVLFFGRCARVEQPLNVPEAPQHLPPQHHLPPQQPQPLSLAVYNKPYTTKGCMGCYIKQLFLFWWCTVYVRHSSTTIDLFNFIITPD